MRTCVLFWLLFVSLSPLHAQTVEGDLEKQIIAQERNILELSTRQDLGPYANHVPDDALAVYSSGYANKKEVLEALHAIDTSDFHYSMDQVKVIPIGSAAALIVYRTAQDWKQGNRKVERDYYVAALWQKQRGRWVSRFWQETDATLPDDQLTATALAKEREFQEAQKRNDWTTCAALLSDDLIAIDEDGIRTKQQLLAEVKEVDVRFSDYKMEDVRAVPEGDGAMVVYKQTLIGTERGKPFTWHIYTHSHWQRRGDKWLLIMFQDSRARE